MQRANQQNFEDAWFRGKIFCMGWNKTMKHDKNWDWYTVPIIRNKSMHNVRVARARVSVNFRVFGSIFLGIIILLIAHSLKRQAVTHHHAACIIMHYT